MWVRSICAYPYGAIRPAKTPAPKMITQAEEPDQREAVTEEAHAPVRPLAAHLEVEACRLGVLDSRRPTMIPPSGAITSPSTA